MEVALGVKRNNYLRWRLEGVIECEILQRLNRFVVAVKTSKGEEKALLRNTGRLEQFLYTGNIGLCKPRMKGKTSYDLIGLREEDNSYAIVDTGLQERLFIDVLKNNMLPPYKECRYLSRSPKYDKHRFDMLLECSKCDLHYVETKSAILKDDKGYALYPDVASERGLKHIMLLTEIVGRKEACASIVFIAAFRSAKGFRPNYHADHKLKMSLQKAVDAGVEISSFRMWGEHIPSRNLLLAMLDTKPLPVEI
jgi:sugar fermentation stimulation protein A